MFRIFTLITGFFYQTLHYKHVSKNIELLKTLFHVYAHVAMSYGVESASWMNMQYILLKLHVGLCLWALWGMVLLVQFTNV
jgi:hypothetical protein